MEKQRTFYTIAMLLTVLGLLLYGAAKVILILTFRIHHGLLLTLPALVMLFVGLSLQVFGVGFFIGLTSTQRKEAKAGQDA